MIKEFEIHVLTMKDLSDIEQVMRELGFKFSKKLLKNGILYRVAGNNKIIEVMIEFYKESQDGIEYKFKVDKLEDFNFIVDFANKI